MGSKHKECMMRGVKSAQMCSRRVLQGVRDIIKTIAPSIWTFLSLLKTKPEDFLNTVSRFPQITRWTMRNPGRENRMPDAPYISLHSMQQIVKLLNMVVVKILSHQAPHDDLVDKEGDFFE